ncbi:MAG: CHAT domain-containing protein [Acidobacteria bacterium]|nr:CHAT domain-containing protein [Acidobacteriota bacterium]
MQNSRLRRDVFVHPFRQTLALLCLVCAGTTFVFAQRPEEVHLQNLTREFYQGFARLDIAEATRFWHETAPGRMAFQQQTAKWFADCSRLELASVTFRPIEWEQTTAHVRVTLAFKATDARTGQALATWNNWQRVISWRPENTGWKIWQERSAYAVWAEKFLSSANEEERQRLLSGAPELVDTELARELHAAGNRRRNPSQPDLPTSLKAYELAYEIALRVNDLSRAGTALLNQAQVLLLQSKYAEALTFGHQSLQKYAAAKNLNGRFDALKELASINMALSNYVEAKAFFDQMIELNDALNDPIRKADAWQNLGAWHFALGNYEQSLDLYERSLALRLLQQRQGSTDVNNTANIGVLRGNLGLSYAALGQYQKALRLYEESLQAARADGRGIGFALNYFGTLYKQQGNYDLALHYCTEAMEANQREKLERDIAVTHNNLGDIHLANGESAQALQQFQTALAIAERLKSPSVIARTNFRLGLASLSQNNPKQAQSYFQIGLDIYLKLNLPESVTTSYQYLATASLAANELEQARQFAEEALSLSRQMEKPELRADVATIAGRVYQALNQPEPAKRAFLEAVAATEKLRAGVVGNEINLQEFFATRTLSYFALMELAAEENQPAVAFAWAERAKARTLLDVLQTGKSKINAASSPAERQQESELTSRLTTLNALLFKEQTQKKRAVKLSEFTAQLDQARLNYEDFRTKLYAAHPELRVQRGEAKPITLAEAAELLPDARTALLHYVVMPEHVRLFIVTKAKDGQPQLRVETLPLKREDLTKRVEQFRQQLADRDPRFGKLAAELYAQLFKAARAYLPARARLVIVPDGPLWELPFQALLNEQNRYLWEEHTLVYAPSLTVLREMLRARPASAKKAAPALLAMGDPQLGGATVARAQQLMGGSFEPLPEARQQVERLQQFYDPQRRKVFVGAAATEAQWKAEAEKADVLHLAAHGVLNDRNPLYSHILLAQNADAREDGLLEAWELMEMNLHADLAVLSACETARGRVGAGEGMIGLTWALFVAGVPSSVVSQWSVSDASTAELMVEFHRQLRTVKAPPNGWTKAEALRQAALKLLRGGKYRHPFDWAGFVLVGKPQ